MPDPETQEMRIEQVKKAAAETVAAHEAAEENETATHDRRAERAAYLKAKLDDRARSEDSRE